MNSTQVTYIKKRIEEIYAENKQKIKSKYVWIKPILTVAQKIELIRKGEFTAKADNHFNSLDSTLVFEQTENPNLKLEAAAYEALRLERTRLLDNLVLGEVQEALTLLENFAKKEF